MKNRTCIAIVSALLLLPGGPVVAVDDVPVTAWVAPAYWKPSPAAPSSPGHQRNSLAAVPMSSPLPFIAMTPCRVVDTRWAPSPFGGPGLSAGETRVFPIPTSGDCPGIPADAAAYSLNVTVVFTKGNGHLTAWPAGGERPGTSTINFVAGQIVANAAIVPTGTDGAIAIYAFAATDVILDINGYYAAPPSAVAAGAGVNPMQIALGRWFGANQTRSPIPGVAGCGPKVFDGSHLWIGDFVQKTVTKVRASDQAVLGTFAVGPQVAAMAFDGASLWVAGFGPASKVRASDGMVSEATAAFDPLDMVFDGTSIWMADDLGHGVFRVRVSDGSSAEYFQAGNVVAVAYDGESIWISIAGGVNAIARLRPSDGATLATYPLERYPSVLLFDGAHIWARVGSSLKKIRARDGVILGSYPVGSGDPLDSLAFDGSYIWVSSYLDSTVMKLRASDGANVATYSFPNPSRLTFDGASMWLTSSLPDSTVCAVTKL